MSEMKQYKVSKILSYISGNQGLTNEVIHLEKSKLNGIDDVEVLSSSVDKSFSMWSTILFKGTSLYSMSDSISI